MGEKTILVTGGAGFIGNCFCKLFLKEFKDWNLVNLDNLTYDSNIYNIKEELKETRYSFYKIDINNRKDVFEVFRKENPSLVVNFAAETHVDKSIKAPRIFLKTNIIGVQNLLDACVRFKVKRFHQIGTDEVYGDLPLESSLKPFTEDSHIKPSNPYSVSKAAADLLVLSYFRMYNLPVTISRCCNNYGPYQFPEKLIPLAILNILNGRKIPLYGDGMNVRDWLYVEDHCKGIIAILKNGVAGQIYNLSSNHEISNLTVIRKILKYMGKDESCIEFVKDRIGHDVRYSIDYSKAFNELHWKPIINFEEGLKKTIQWYLNNKEWLRLCTKPITN